MSTSTAGVPIKLLHEAESHIVTVELKTGEAYRGILTEAEETMNCQLKEGEQQSYLCIIVRWLNFDHDLVTMTSRDGRVTKLEHVFLRGGQIKFVVLPELLKNAPIFKKVQALKAKKVEAQGKVAAKGARPAAKIKK